MADQAWQLLLKAIDLSKKIQVQAEADLIVSGFSPRSEWDNGEIDFAYVRYGATLSHEIDRERSCLAQMRDQGVLDRFEVPPFTLAINGERLFLHDLIQWSFSDDGDDNDYLLAEGLPLSVTPGGQRSLFRASVNRFYYVDRKTTERLLDDYMQDLIRLAGMLPIDRRSSIESARFDESMLSSPRYMFLAAIIPALEKAQTKSSIVQLQTEGTRLMLAIEMFFARHGELPKQLNDLVPNILAELPIDPIHGGSFLYRQLENDSRNRRYLLYSSGLDQQDNGGDFSLLDSFEAVTHPPANTDVLVNQLRPALDDY